MEQDKINAYMTLYEVIVKFSKAAAPMTPFMTESIYQNLVAGIDKDAPESIHLCDFPKYDETAVDAELEEKMGDVLQAVVLGRACRNATNIKTRQPIGKMYICAPFSLDDFYTDIIRDELNVKEVIWKTDVSEYTRYTLKPQLKTLGPKFGKSIGKIKKMLEELDGNKAMEEVNATGALSLELDGEKISIEKEDLLIGMVQQEGFTADSDNGITVVFDTKLTPELIEEGHFREIVSKLQTMRKDAGFEVMDKIDAWIKADEVQKAAQSYSDQIAGTVLADAFYIGEDPAEDAFIKEWDINGENVILAVRKR